MFLENILINKIEFSFLLEKTMVVLILNTKNEILKTFDLF